MPKRLLLTDGRSGLFGPELPIDQPLIVVKRSMMELGASPPGPPVGQNGPSRPLTIELEPRRRVGPTARERHS